jgi:hypothetical protein
MRFLAAFALLLLASCGLPGTGPAQWTELEPSEQAEFVPGQRPSPPALAPARTTVRAPAPQPAALADASVDGAAASPATDSAAAAVPTVAPAQAAAPVQAEAEESATPPRQAAAADPNVEQLRSINLSAAQLLAVQTGIRESLRDDTARLERAAAGENSLGVAFVCGYADVGAGGGRQTQPFRGVLMGKDRPQPKFVPVSASAADQQATARVCAAQGIPLSGATARSMASAPPAQAPDVSAAAPTIAADDVAPTPVAAPVSAPMPKVVLTEPQINVVQSGVKNSLNARTAVFGRMLAVADAKGGIVVCGYVSPSEGEGAGGGIQPFTGVLIGQGDQRNFVPVGFGRSDAEKRETMQVCAGQGIPL